MYRIFQLFLLNFTSHKISTIMGLVYFYKADCYMLGADVAVLLNSRQTYNLAAS